MEIVTSNHLNHFDNTIINGIYGDVYDLSIFGIDVKGITYDDKWTVKKFLHSYKNKKRIESIFKYLDLDLLLLKEKIINLSSSDFKWILLAYMLITNKEIIIFDYFDVGLNYKNQKKLVNIIKSLKKDGKKVMVISNDPVFLNKVIDKVYVIDKGKVVFEGNLIEVFKKKIIEEPEIIKFIKLANKKDSSIELTLDNNELLKNIYRSVV